MRNNAIKKFPKDFGSTYALDTYNEFSDETVRDTTVQIKTEANIGEYIDADFEDDKPDEDSSDDSAGY